MSTIFLLEESSDFLVIFEDRKKRVFNLSFPSGKKKTFSLKSKKPFWLTEKGKYEIESLDLENYTIELRTISNPFVGFWESQSRGNNSLEILAEGNFLYYRIYTGNSINGFQLSNINEERFLSPINQGYRHFLGYGSNISIYFFLNQFDKNQLYNFSGGTANPVNLQPILYKFSRNENPKIILFDTKINTSPTGIFNNWFNTNFLTLNNQFSRNLKSVDFPGMGEITDIYNQILKNEIVETFEGTDIWPELSVFTLTNAIFPENPIKLFPVFESKDVFINVFFLANNFPQNAGFNIFAFETSETLDLELFMLVEISEVSGLSNLPKEWVNGLFYVQAINNISTGIQIWLTPLLLEGRYPNNLPVYVSKNFKLTPLCFKLTVSNISNLISTFNGNNLSVIELSNFESNIISENIINNRFTIYSQSENNNQRFLYLIIDNIYTFKESINTGGNNGKLSLCTFPENNNFARLVNVKTLLKLPSPLTYFFTKEPTLTSPCSKIEISGLIGEYSILNGVHESHPYDEILFNCKSDTKIWNDKCYLKNRKFLTAVNVKSSGLPSYDPEKHGTFILRRKVSQINNSSSYGEFIDACSYLFKKSGVNTHGINIFHTDYIRGNINVSWKNIQNQIINLQTEKYYFMTNRSDDSIGGYKAYYGTPLVNNMLLNELNKNCHQGKAGFPINSSLRLDPTRTSTLLISNQINKYLDTSQIYKIYATISGPVLNQRVPGSDPFNLNISTFLTSFGYNANGTRISYHAQKNGQYISPILLQLITPSPNRYFLENSFAENGAVLRLLTEDLILANPPLANRSLLNAAACVNKIVIVIRGVVSFADKYLNCVNANARAVIIINNNSENIGSATLGFNIINNIMIYSLNGLDGNKLTGFNGGNVNIINNYSLSTTNPTGYRARILPNPNPLSINVVGDSFRYGIIDKKFTGNKNVGYVFLPDNLQVTSQFLETYPLFFDIYNQSTFVDGFAKFWATVLSTPFIIDNEEILFSHLDSIILDNSINSGGFFESCLALSFFFGKNRPNLFTESSFNGNGFSSTINSLQTLGNFPNESLRNVKFTIDTSEIECDKYQQRYPLARFRGNKVIIMNSTVSFSGGDLFSHVFRNAKNKDVSDLGNNVYSSILGTIDGRLQGYSQINFFSNLLNKDSPFFTNNGQLIPAFLTVGESFISYSNQHTKKNLCNQLPEIEITGEPLPSWREDEAGLYQAWGFSESYIRNNSKYEIFNQIIGLPQRYQPNTYHYPLLEDAILEAKLEK